MSGVADALLDALAEEQDRLAERVREALQVQIPAFRNLPPGEFDGEVAIGIAQVLQHVRAGREAVHQDNLNDLAAVGQARAHQGVSLTDMLRAWHIGIGVAVRHASEVGERLGLEDAEVLNFVESILPWSDAAIATSSDAYQRVARSLSSVEETQRAEFVRRLLFGTIPATELRRSAEAYGIEPAREYIAVRARPGGGDAARRLELALGFNDPSHGFCDLADGDTAGFLSEPPRPDVDGVVGYGPPRPLDRLAESYQLATRALVTAQACGLSGAHDISSLGLRMTVATDMDVGDFVRKRYLEPLEKSGSGGELIATLRAYLACGRHVERTATRLGVHQNTVRYRLARFEELTRTSLQDTETLLETWWAVELSAMRL